MYKTIAEVQNNRKSSNWPLFANLIALTMGANFSVLKYLRFSMSKCIISSFFLSVDATLHSFTIK